MFRLEIKTLVQHLANRTNCKMYIPYDVSLGTSPLNQGEFTIAVYEITSHRVCRKRWCGYYNQ